MWRSNLGATYVAWRDTRNNATTGGDIYAQKFDSDGALLWEANGLAICTVEGNQQFPTITPDGVGGAVVVWLDGRAPNVDTISAQHISASGTVQWPTDGVVCRSRHFSARHVPLFIARPMTGF
jgi:hypothetical protein